MGCGGGGTTTQTTKQEIDPRMAVYLYGPGQDGGGGGDFGLYGTAKNLFMGRTPEQSVAGFNPLQQFAMTQMANFAQNPNFGNQQNSQATIQKLMQRGGVNYQPQQFTMPQFDTSQMFMRRGSQPAVAISPDAVIGTKAKAG